MILRKQMIVLLILIVLMAMLIILISIAHGKIRGTSAERIEIIESAKKYVIETYGLTPTHVHITNLFMGYPVYVRFHVEEHNFTFEAFTARHNYDEWRDDYVKKMVEYILVNDIDAYVKEFFQEKAYANIMINSNRYYEFTADELLFDPSIAFGIKEEHFCRIFISENPLSENYEFDYELLYGIYLRIFDVGLNPDSIIFLFDNPNRRSRFNYILIKFTKMNRSDGFNYSAVTSLDEFTRLFQEQFTISIERGW